MEEKNPPGIYLNTDALADRVLERLGKSVDTVLKTAQEETIITELTVPNEPDGMEIIFHNQTQDLAYTKPELAETSNQKRLLQLKAEDRLRQWEVRLAISDEALKNKKQNAGDYMSAVNAGKAFAKAVNAEGLTNMYGGVVGTAVTTPWNLATNAQIENDIINRKRAIKDEGFKPDIILINDSQWARMHHTLNAVMFSGQTVEQWLGELGLRPIIVDRINYKNNNGTLINLFNPDGQVLIIDSKAYSVFTQEQMTVEMERDIKIGGWVAYFRKFFRTTPVQPESAARLIGTVI